MPRAARWGAGLLGIALAALITAPTNAGGPDLDLDENCEPQGLIGWVEARLDADGFWGGQYVALAVFIEFLRADYADTMLEIQKIRTTMQIEAQQAAIRARMEGGDPQAAARATQERLREDWEFFVELAKGTQESMKWAARCRMEILRQRPSIDIEAAVAAGLNPFADPPPQ